MALSKFMIAEWPSKSCFRDVATDIIGLVCRQGPVRMFGEMVAILWAEGHTQSALQLKELHGTSVHGGFRPTNWPMKSPSHHTFTAVFVNAPDT